MMTDRDILKIKLMASGFKLNDDNCIYKGDKIIAKDVEVLDKEDPDAIVFRFDLLRDDRSLKRELNLKPDKRLRLIKDI